MMAKKVDALEEKLEGEDGQLKSAFEERISSMEDRFSNLEGMMKRVLELQTKPAESPEICGLQKLLPSLSSGLIG